MIPGLLLDKRVLTFLAIAAFLALQVYFVVTGSIAANSNDRELSECGADRASPQCFR